MLFNVDKYNSTQVDTQNISYDYQSVMHYAVNQFSVNGLPTIEPLQPNVKIGNRPANEITLPPTSTMTSTTGTDAIANSWPWIKKRIQGTSVLCYLCDATLINKDYAITSAQCIGTINPSDGTLIAGMHNKVSTTESDSQQWRT
ncbi:hypothetical protein I4U23_004090 [Adineta vaga]|nr:hypothetical protein I4U23_004090 [Adineta vaga]